jgi:hypothetical protein
VKLLIGVLSLLAAFAAAALWQSRWHAEAEAQREALRAGAPSSIEIAPEGEAPGWGRVIVGRPSGVDPVERGALNGRDRRERRQRLHLQRPPDATPTPHPQTPNQVIVLSGPTVEGRSSSARAEVVRPSRPREVMIGTACARWRER